jgi:hypothetical protein
MSEQPTDEQLEAIKAFAKKHGPHWKADLGAAWANGKDTNEPNGHLLRQVRNNFGPRWLIKFKL